MDLPCVLACGEWENEGCATPRELSGRSDFLRVAFGSTFAGPYDILEDGRFRVKFVHPGVVSEAIWGACCAAFFQPQPLPRLDPAHCHILVSFADYVGLQDDLKVRLQAIFREIPLSDFPRDELLGLAQDPGALEILDSIGEVPIAKTSSELLDELHPSLRRCMRGVRHTAHALIPASLKGSFPELSPEAVLRLYRLWARRMRENGWDVDAYLDVFEEPELLEKLREAYPGARVVATEREFSRNLSAGTGHVWLERAQSWLPKRFFLAGGAVTAAACGFHPPEGDLDMWIQGPGLFRG